MRFNHGFIGYSCPNTVYNFLSADDEDRFNRNLKTQPDDWYYRFNEITYDINNLGHRSKNIDDIDLDNYVLFTGCSHAEGVGLELEKTFPYLAASDLGVDYYNLGLGGTGIDVMTYNLMIWIQTVKKLPKALVIMLPEPNRYVKLDEEDEFLSLVVPSCAPSSDCEKFMVLGEKIRFFEAVGKMSENLVSASYPCKKLNIDWSMLGGRDKARDLSHAGIESNRAVADQIVQDLIDIKN